MRSQQKSPQQTHRKRRGWLSAARLRAVYRRLREFLGAAHDPDICLQMFERVAWTDNSGYRRIRLPRGSHLHVHRGMMMAHLRRPLRPREVVHHRDENRANNRVENLQIMSPENHRWHHRPGAGMYVNSTKPGSGAIYSVGPHRDKRVARVVMELALLRKLRPEECVICLSPCKLDNRPLNLRVVDRKTSSRFNIVAWHRGHAAAIREVLGEEVEENTANHK